MVERDEAHVAHDEVGPGKWQGGRVSRARRSSTPSRERTPDRRSRRGCSSVAPDVDRRDPRRAARQQHVGEAADGGADVRWQERPEGSIPKASRPGSASARPATPRGEGARNRPRSRAVSGMASVPWRTSRAVGDDEARRDRGLRTLARLSKTPRENEQRIGARVLLSRGVLGPVVGCEGACLARPLPSQEHARARVVSRRSVHETPGDPAMNRSTSLALATLLAAGVAAAPRGGRKTRRRSTPTRRRSSARTARRSGLLTLRGGPNGVVGPLHHRPGRGRDRLARGAFPQRRRLLRTRPTSRPRRATSPRRARCTATCTRTGRKPATSRTSTRERAGPAVAEFATALVTFDGDPALFDEDGSALVIHEKPRRPRHPADRRRRRAHRLRGDRARGVSSVVGHRPRRLAYRRLRSTG